MPKIPQNLIDQILAETDIVSIVGESVALRKAGNNLKGLCPFHNEKTPSFVVSPEKQIYHCFGCGEGGAVVQFLMKSQRMAFREAIEFLAKRLHITLPDSGTVDPKDEKKQKLYKINQYARWFFKDELEKSQRVQEYLKSRHFTSEIIEKFNLGYGPDSFEALLSFFKKKKIPLEWAETLGLVKKSQRSQGYYDFYRDRLIFPISSSSGAVIGFGGRILKSDEKQAKYINSPETPIYHKSYELYGFYENKADIFQSGQVIFVEGYTDVLACVQMGLKQAVAPLGTSLTKDQIRKLKRYNLEMILMFDGDQAGQNACRKALEMCFDEGIHPKVALLPDGKDPGDYLNQDHEILKKIVDSAPYAMDWLMTDLFQKTSSTASDQSQAIQKIKQWLRRLPKSESPQPYWQKAQQYFDVPHMYANKVIENTSQFVMRRESFGGVLSLEEILILLFVQSPEAFPEKDLSKFGQNFEDLSLKQLADSIHNFVKNHETFAPKDAIRELPENLQKLYSRILASEENYKNLTPESYFHQFWQKSKKRRLRYLSAKIAEAELKKDDALKMQLLAEQQHLLNS